MENSLLHGKQGANLRVCATCRARAAMLWRTGEPTVCTVCQSARFET